LREFRSSFRVIAHASLAGRAAETIRVSEAGAPGFDEDAVSSITRVKPRGEKVQKHLAIVGVQVSCGRRRVNDDASLRVRIYQAYKDGRARFIQALSHARFDDSRVRVCGGLERCVLKSGHNRV